MHVHTEPITPKITFFTIKHVPIPEGFASQTAHFREVLGGRRFPAQGTGEEVFVIDLVPPGSDFLVGPQSI